MGGGKNFILLLGGLSVTICAGSDGSIALKSKDVFSLVEWLYDPPPEAPYVSISTGGLLLSNRDLKSNTFVSLNCCGDLNILVDDDYCY